MKRKFLYARSYIILILCSIIAGYPILWLFCSSFKDSASIFASIRLLPVSIDFSGYIDGWKSTSLQPFSMFLVNSLKLVIPTVLLTCVSASLVAYGFTRFTFPLKKFWFAIMISTLMLPNTILMIPRYILFRNLRLLNSYSPFYLMAILGANPFFAYSFSSQNWK